MIKLVEGVNNLIINCDCIEAMKELEENSVDAIVTDPPYGLEFMGKNWDRGIPGKPFFIEMIRVLKPGGFLLAMGGTRTYHRLVCGIENAGFEIRDTIMWLYGSGFPKSLNIGKQIDKLQGNDREDLGIIKGAGNNNTYLMNSGVEKSLELKPYYNNSKGNSEWEGWGTALKPSQEMIVMATKPLNSVPSLLNDIKCKLNLNANVVEELSKLNLQELNEDMLNSVLMNVYQKQNIKVDSKELMDILQSKQKKENIDWSMMLSWKNIWEEILNLMNISTIEIKSEMTIELRTLNLLLGKLTIQDILRYEILQNGNQSNVLLVENLLKGILVKLRGIQIASVQDNAILMGKEMDLHPNASPIVVARKPLSEKNVALNVLKWGTGGINIDACRISVDMNKEGSNAQRIDKTYRGTSAIWNNANSPTTFDGYSKGRFPANIILDEEAGKMLDEQSGERKGMSSQNNFANGNIYRGQSLLNSKTKLKGFREWYNDKGGASRFFYCAKASKSERNFGCEGMEDKQKCPMSKESRIGECINASKGMERFETICKNNHPTVKPIKLMEYLIKLVSKEGAIVLDPFLGSGTTGIACAKLNRKFIGIEKEAEYIKIAEARIKPYTEQTKLTSEMNRKTKND